MTRADEDLIMVHARLPKSLYGKLLKRLDKLRKKDPLANLSDAIRSIIAEVRP